MDTSGPATTPETTDGRLQRGARSRRAVTRRAVDIASLDGLDGLSFGRLSDDLSLSKAGIQTLFRTKEALQLATAEAAREAFVDAVIHPALDSPAGLPRLRALIDNWIEYASAPLFPGGCFWGANLPIFDSRPGPVRDALRDQQRAWLTTLATQFRQAVDAGEIPETDPDTAAFQTSALLNALNVCLRLGDDTATALTRRALDSLLRP
ncbi:TetR/AcrR family transcriptional regulator [Nocardia concava]|uniref:TetR/AcrR family transcriptional regulator n=1 Tax=Nocardia concava TaxID=257281 RepID=UPI0005930300|nr:TetR/AcrR family transcriptional regulator [Nocardia concava]